MSIAKQTAGYMLAMIFLRMQAFLLLPFVARFVPGDELSVFDTVIGYATVVGMFAVLGCLFSRSQIWKTLGRRIPASSSTTSGSSQRTRRRASSPSWAG